MVKMYTAQFKQDEYLDNHVFNKMEGGVFVEVGAADGIRHSNTYFFEKIRKWSGLCIEPRKSEFIKLEKNRKCAKLLACIDEKADKFNFLQIYGYGNQLSGLTHRYNKAHIERIARETIEYNSKKEEYEIVTERLDVILDKYKLFKINYLSIDTEGNELYVLKSIDFKKIHIDVISIEINYKQDEIDIFNFLKSHGYKEIKKLGPDYIFRRDSFE